MQSLCAIALLITLGAATACSGGAGADDSRGESDALVAGIVVGLHDDLRTGAELTASLSEIVERISSQRRPIRKRPASGGADAARSEPTVAALDAPPDVGSPAALTVDSTALLVTPVVVGSNVMAVTGDGVLVTVSSPYQAADAAADDPLVHALREELLRWAIAKRGLRETYVADAIASGRYVLATTLEQADAYLEERAREVGRAGPRTAFWCAVTRFRVACGSCRWRGFRRTERIAISPLV
jgi:hypothetical protein